MENKEQHIDNLLVKHLLGETTPDEALQVQSWIDQSARNRKYYEDFKHIWEQSKEQEKKSTVNEEEAWARFRQRTIREATLPRTLEMPRRRMPWLRIAAVLLVLAGGATLAYLTGNSSGGALVALNSNDKVLIDTLPDGSIVTLNKYSTLTYNEDTKGNTRSVTLTGEAFFNVTPDKSKPFIISAEEASVRVVGTSFNVKATEAKTEVVVETGVVEVAKNEHKIELKPNEKGIVLKDRHDPLKQRNTDELYNYYRTKEFVCNGTPLWRLVDVLNQAYNVDIIIANEQVKSLPLTATFSNESLDSILAVISETFAIKVERDNGRIILK